MRSNIGLALYLDTHMPCPWRVARAPWPCSVDGAFVAVGGYNVGLFIVAGHVADVQRAPVGEVPVA